MFFKKSKLLPKSIIVPLYIYPYPHAWAPLHKAILSAPHITFFLIVNPNSGPGTSPPDEHYAREIPLLAAHPNAVPIGYVSTAWARRDLSLALQDVATYGGWPAACALQGVFFDETPGEHDARQVAYLGALAAAVRTEKGLGPRNTVVFNPGRVQDVRIEAAARPDLTVVFEASFATYEGAGRAKGFRQEKVPGERQAAMIHSVPGKVSGKDFVALMAELGDVVGFVYITEQADDGFYTRWGPRLQELARVLEEAAVKG